MINIDPWLPKTITIILTHQHLATAIVYHPFSLAVWEEHLYWTDWNQMRVQSCIKRDGRHVKTILKGTGEHQYFGLSLYHPAMYNQVLSRLVRSSPPVETSVEATVKCTV